MGQEDGRVTLQEMIWGFRKIRRQWANLQTEEAGRAVLTKLLRLMERAGMSLEAWFNFMDTSQGGNGDGKLTVLELRGGFQRLAAHIAMRECCCRAHKCQRIPNYGLPPLVVGADPGAATSTTSDIKKSLSSKRSTSPTRNAASVSANHTSSPTTGQDAAEGSFPEFKAPIVVKSETTADKAEPLGANQGATKVEGHSRPAGSRADFEQKERDAAKKLEVELYWGGEREAEDVRTRNAGKAIACREHALEYMVYLGPRWVIK